MQIKQKLEGYIHYYKRIKTKLKGMIPVRYRNHAYKPNFLLFKELHTDVALNKVNYLLSQLHLCCLKSITIRP
ncbi:IS3 family transposase [Bacillus cereus]|uniref:IS3 family transposase n=1 Tax=Bacillus cereus TaxID=1396 RepID=UPI003D34CBC1